MITRIVFTFLVFLSLAFSQSDRGTITGQVLDQTGAAIPEARITAINSATQVRYTAVSNDTGNFTIPQLPSGDYEVTVEATGFRRFAQKGIGISILQTVNLILKTQVGDVEQVMEVSADVVAIETTTSDLGTAVSKEKVVDLPLAVSGNMRHPGAFVFLAPGVTGDTSNTQINGSQNRSKEILLDGVGSVSPESGGLLFTYPSVEAINEFKLVSANFSAEYGRTGGGFEVYTTKSGTNDFHGGIFDYLRNDQLDARGFFARTRPVNRQNEYGAYLGGPVLLPKLYNGKNRTFFHFVWSGFRLRQGALNELYTLPTEAMRRGDFSAVGRPIYDPATTRTDANGNFIRDQFPGNIIPASRFSRVSQNSLPVIPGVSNPNLTLNYQAVGARTFDRDQYNVKIDHNFSDNQRFNVYYYQNSQNDVGAAQLEGPLSPARATQRPGIWVRLNHDSVISATMLNNFRAGFTREPERFQRTTVNEDWPTKLGLTGINTGPGNVFPRVTFTDGLTNWSDETKNAGQQVNNAYQFADTLSVVTGKHTVKFGMDARWLQTNGADPFDQQGIFRFSNLETALPASRANTGHAFASYLLGLANSAQANFLFVVPANRYRYIAFFAQDDWKITRRLTLNLGLRYDIFFPRTEKYGNFSGFDPLLPNPGAGDLPGAVAFLGEGPGRDNSRSSFARTDYKNIGPRVGFAYALGEKTVLRGGYGIYYAAGNATTGLRCSQCFIFGFNAAPAYQSPDAGITPALRWDNGFPTDYPRPPFINPTVQNRSNVNMIGRDDGRAPYFQNYSFGIQRELAGTVFDVSYVGVKGTRLGTGLFGNINQVDSRYLELGSLLTQSITSPQAVAAGFRPPYAGFTGSVAQALRPYPQYLNVENRSNPNGNSTYHALQVKVEKRLRAGLTFLGSYTRSKNISDGDIMAGGGPGGQNFYNRRLEKTISTNDVPHVGAISALYELPLFRTNKWLGGWTLTGIAQYQSGRPIALTANNTLPLFNNTLRPDVVIGQTKEAAFEDPATDYWINRAAFTSPAPFRFGTSARAYTDLRAPAYLNESVGLIKRTNLTERLLLTFRAEFFNVFNRTVFAAPNANVNNLQFGRISGQANSPRQGQVALRLEF